MGRKDLSQKTKTDHLTPLKEKIKKGHPAREGASIKEGVPHRGLSTMRKEFVATTREQNLRWGGKGGEY